MPAHMPYLRDNSAPNITIAPNETSKRKSPRISRLFILSEKRLMIPPYSFWMYANKIPDKKLGHLKARLFFRSKNVFVSCWECGSIHDAFQYNTTAITASDERIKPLINKGIFLLKTRYIINGRAR